MAGFNNDSNYLGTNDPTQQGQAQQQFGLPTFEQGLQNITLPNTVSNLEIADNGFFGNLTAQGIGQGLQGLAGVGQFGLGVANYFQNKRNFKDMMNLQLADRRTQLGLANQSLASERARLRRGGVSQENLKNVPTSVK